MFFVITQSNRSSEILVFITLSLSVTSGRTIPTLNSDPRQVAGDPPQSDLTTNYDNVCSSQVVTDDKQGVVDYPNFGSSGNPRQTFSHLITPV